jgi:hypothetical protein
MAVRRKKTKRNEARVRFREDPPLKTDLRYWLIHALHWHALLLAVIGVLVVGSTYFNKADF